MWSMGEQGEVISQNRIAKHKCGYYIFKTSMCGYLCGAVLRLFYTIQFHAGVVRFLTAWIFLFFLNDKYNIFINYS